MSVKISILTLGMLLSAALCKAQGLCPWINTATVVDAPDPTVSEVQSSVANDGDTCVFHFRKADSVYSVQIAIHAAAGNGRDMAADEAQCKSDKVTLAHIGNEAILCSTGAHAERAIGRVRDKIFVITIDAKGEHGSAGTAKPLRDMASLFAGQVAGNLF
jgi:hypothetical protein